MAKVFINHGDGFEYIGDAGSMTIQFIPDPLDAEFVVEDVLDADEIGTEPPLIING